MKIFDQKISFFNPVNLFGNIDIKDLSGETYASQTRNKLIAVAFYLTKDIEKYGSGFLRIRNEIKEFPTMCFSYQESGNGFLAELSYTAQKKASDVSNETPILKKTKQMIKGIKNKVGDNLSDTQNKILELIKKTLFISAQGLSESIGISIRKIKENIHKLKDKLKHLGSHKSGHWKVL